MNLQQAMVVRRLADAIAYAEGFFVTGSRPQRNHNPGDLELDVTGKGVGQDGPYVVYATDEDGWDALEAQVGLMFGGSRIYNASMTIAEMASHYTSTQVDDWAANVAKILHVPVTTRLEDLT